MLSAKAPQRASMRRAAAVHDLVNRWKAAEAMTDAAYGGALSVLTPAERNELDGLLLEAEAVSR